MVSYSFNVRSAVAPRFVRTGSRTSVASSGGKAFLDQEVPTASWHSPSLVVSGAELAHLEHVALALQLELQFGLGR